MKTTSVDWELKTDEDWRELVDLVNNARMVLNNKPAHLKCGTNAEEGSVLNSYREGDINFVDAVDLLKRIRLAKKSKQKFDLGQEVYFQVTAEVKGIKLASYEKFTIVEVSLSSDSEKLTYHYALSVDPPAPYYAGKGIQFDRIKEELLRETKS